MAGASPSVLEALVEANAGPARSYGADRWTLEAERVLADVFERDDLKAFFVTSGTAANSLALSALAQPWNGVLCHPHAHILEDECGAPEFFTGGARLIPISGPQGKIAGKLTAGALQWTLERLPADAPHNVTPSVVSLSQASECGLVYRPEEIAALAEVARSRALTVQVDGARFANAVASLGCKPSELTWKAGVDVLCLGASKTGALAAEAVIFFHSTHAAHFATRRKRGGHLVAKGRFLGAQFTGWLRDDDWLELARTANLRAAQLAEGLSRTFDVRLVWPTEANEVFAILPKSIDAKLRAAGCYYYEWNPASLPPGESVAPDEVFVRLVTSFATTSEEVSEFLDLAGAL
jgi:threonine aldolase